MNQTNRSDKSNNSRGNSSKKGRPQRSPKSSNPANKRRNSRPRRTGPKLSGFEKVERGYINLLEKHLEARKKYFDLFHRADPRQLAKLERIFSRSADELREYEDAIKPEYKEEFEKKYNGLKLDTTYSENHELPVEAPLVATEGDFEDPHLLQTQVDHEFKGDQEESAGSIEDYQRYKGIESTSDSE